MGFVLSFIKIKGQPMGRQVCLTMPFNELIAYLDSLASRKAGGDKTAQTEIEAVSALLSSK